jgi:hypothetical protein
MGRVILEKLIVVQVFVEHEGTFPSPREPATVSVLLILPYPNIDKTYKQPQNQFH